MIFAKSCKVKGVYVELTFNEIFIAGVNPSTCHRFWKYCAPHHQAEVPNIAFMVQSLLAIQKKRPNRPLRTIKPHPTRCMESILGAIHLHMQSSLDHQLHQHVRPNIAQNRLRYSLFKQLLHLTQDRTLLHRLRSYHRSLHSISR